MRAKYILAAAVIAAAAVIFLTAAQRAYFDERIMQMTRESLERQTIAAEEVERHACQDALNLTGTIRITTIGDLAAETDAAAIFESMASDPVVLLVLDAPSSVTARRADGGSIETMEAQTVRLPSTAASRMQEGERVSVSDATGWACWPSDVSGVLWDVDASHICLTVTPEG